VLTIARFAELTGISPSALRFYERRGLLLPARRLPNGYRAYAPEQAETAQTLNSLREAGIGLREIRRFLDAGADERRALLEAWREEVAARLLALRVADRYLGGLHPEDPQIHLHRWAEPSLLLWFPAAGPAGPLPFTRAVEEAGRALQRPGLRVLAGGFVRTLDRVGARLEGEVGFRVRPPRGRLPAGARVEEVPPTLFATLECGVDDDRAAHRVFRFLDEFGFRVAGPALERYLPAASDRYQLMIGITR